MRTEDRTRCSSLDVFARPGAMTSAGERAQLLAGLPGDVAGLVGVGQGLLIHEHIAPAYGVELSDERRSCVHVRPVARLLERLVAEDDRPLAVARRAEERLGGNCRHFSVLLVAVLRERGVPARARCGFGGYFGTGTWEDHWVAEYWHGGKGCWVAVDAQIDDRQRTLFPIGFDTLDVPPDRFLPAGRAWARCRAGDVDPAAFGLSVLGEGGLWWIAGNLLRDVAALNAMEMLPWDVWGAMPAPDEPIGDDRLALFDRLAALTEEPDAGLPALRGLYEEDDRLRVPSVVRNDVRSRDEAALA